MAEKQFKTTIGGQALIEGILMRGPEKQCIVVRGPEGLVIKEEELKLIKDRYPILGLPFLRGSVTFLDSMVKGVKALMFSADYFPEEAGVEEPSKFEQWLDKKLGNEKMEKAVIGFSVALAVCFSIGLFMLLPTFLASFVEKVTDSVLVRNLADAALRIAIFMTYMIAVSRMKDIRRTFSYHGAEHKTIFCYEKGLELTVDNVRMQSKHHPPAHRYYRGDPHQYRDLRPVPGGQRLPADAGAAAPAAPGGGHHLRVQPLRGGPRQPGDQFPGEARPLDAEFYHLRAGRLHDGGGD